MSLSGVKSIFSYRKFWAERLGPAPYLPMSRAEMDELEWECCDIILITGDAYVDHPSFGMALVGRLLEAQGFRVGVIAQPDWQSAGPFTELGRPNLFFGVTAGNMDSMVNRYTAERRIRSDDAYSPQGAAGRRPDRSVLVYSQRCREAYPEVPIVIGGIEASLRRVAHYDYWSDKVRRSILPDSKADLLVYGNAERQIVEIAHRLAAGEAIDSLRDIRGTAFMTRELLPGYREAKNSAERANRAESNNEESEVVRLHGYEEVSQSKLLYAQASRLVHLETNPGNAQPLVQRHGDRELWLNPPPWPLSTRELDAVYELPYQRKPHPAYGEDTIPAYEMIRFSVNIMRGCFGGCSFCSITEHEGRIIQNRSEQSILREIENVRELTPEFTGHISDLGGPTANMYRMGCRSPEIESLCRRLSCIHPVICKQLKRDHQPLIALYRQARKVEGVKKIFIASGLRYDLSLDAPEYIRELATHHVGGYLKVAPEHSEPNVLDLMMKPGIETFDRFKKLFEKYSEQAGKEQYLIPYFIAAHPGATDEDMLALALWLKENKFRPQQVQQFLPAPLASATTMYHTGYNPLHKISDSDAPIFSAHGARQRRLHKAFLRYHDPDNWPLLRSALKRLGREELIGNGKRQLIPNFQPRSGRPEPSRKATARRNR